jgi:hypothetical protein
MKGKTYKRENLMTNRGEENGWLDGGRSGDVDPFLDEDIADKHRKTSGPRVLLQTLKEGWEG